MPKFETPAREVSIRYFKAILKLRAATVGKGSYGALPMQVSSSRSCVQLLVCARRLCGLGTLSLYDEAVAWTRTLQSSGVAQ